MKRILTARLILEPVTSVNAAVLWKIMQAGQLREYQDVPRYTRDEFARRVAARPKSFDAAAFGRFEWLLELASTRVPIGWVSLRVGDRARGAAEVGYSLILGYRRQGYALEATQAVVHYAFEESDLRSLDACCVPANAASRRLLQQAGFAEVRLQKHGAIVRGRPVDILTFELTREQWTALEASGAAARAYGESENSIVMPASGNPK